jgi:hypothetical protein
MRRRAAPECRHDRQDSRRCPNAKEPMDPAWTCCKSEMAVSSPAQVFPRCITRTSFLVLRDDVQFPIAVSWRATKTTFVSLPARSAIVVAGGQPRAESVGSADTRPASSVRSIARFGAPAAIRTGTPTPGREAAGSTRGAGGCNGVEHQGSERVEPGRERGAPFIGATALASSLSRGNRGGGAPKIM